MFSMTHPVYVDQNITGYSFHNLMNILPPDHYGALTWYWAMILEVAMATSFDLADKLMKACLAELNWAIVSLEIWLFQETYSNISW